jgi:hypothetical protein
MSLMVIWSALRAQEIDEPGSRASRVLWTLFSVQMAALALVYIHSLTTKRIPLVHEPGELLSIIILLALAAWGVWSALRTRPMSIASVLVFVSIMGLVMLLQML